MSVSSDYLRIIKLHINLLVIVRYLNFSICSDETSKQIFNFTRKKKCFCEKYTKNL